MPVEYIILEGSKLNDGVISIEAIFGFTGALDNGAIADAKARINAEIKKKFPGLDSYRLRTCIDIDSKKSLASIKGEGYFKTKEVQFDINDTENICWEGCTKIGEKNV